MLKDLAISDIPSSPGFVFDEKKRKERFHVHLASDLCPTFRLSSWVATRVRIQF